MRFAFVGLGQMGGPMALNLARAHDVLAFDRDSRRREALAELGLAVAEQPSDLAGRDVVLLCLPDGGVVESALFAEGGLAARLHAGAVVVDCSTIEHAAALRIAGRLAAAEVEFIDAPVSGMPLRAESGTLTMMCGGREDLVERLRGALMSMASKVLWMGPTGSGQLTKMINNLLYDINLAAMAEILPMAVKLGLDPVQIGEVVNSGTGRSYASEFFIPHILRGSFDNGYPMALAYKDLIGGAELSARHGIPTPVLGAATASYQQALLRGYGDKDKGAMIRVFEELLGVEVRAKETKGAEA